MDFLAVSVLLACACGPRAGAVRRAGWLDRLVRHHRNLLLEDVARLPPVDIQATIEKAPPGYVDSPAWDAASVARLLALIRVSETARPVLTSLRRALAPTRRFMSKQKSYKFFPSLQKYHMSNFYYDQEYTEYESREFQPALAEDAVVLVHNPVEARLPSARISVTLLKDILEARALAARKMPTTQKKTTRTTKAHSAATTEPSTSDSNATEAMNATTLSSNNQTEAEGGSATTDSTGEPATGESATGESATGESATGESATGESATGDAAGDTATTEPAAEAEPPARRRFQNPFDSYGHRSVFYT